MTPDTPRVPDPLGPPRSRLGRPLQMTPAEVLQQIRDLAAGNNLFRVHRAAPGLYARARRQFGSWAEAVRAAGMDYGQALHSARRRSLETRRSRRGRPDSD